ncbi:hypothetical protein B0J14DRAFT_483696, partial [Halenospora varia]
DPLCINQKDLVERGLQVLRMGLIYSRAGRVIAWLGAENPHDMQEEGSAHARQKTPPR